MSSTAQINANRENAQKSTGPVTPEGKAASSQNRFAHGFRGVFRVLPGESQEFFNLLLDSLRAEHQPTTVTEEILIQRMAQHHWLSERARGTIQLAIETSDVPFAEMMPEVQLWMRYQTSNERAFSRCLTDLLKLRAERRNMEVGFERQKREAAAEPVKQEAQQAKTRLANARAEAMERKGHACVPTKSVPAPDLQSGHPAACPFCAHVVEELDTAIKAPLPGSTPIDFNELRSAVSHAIRQLAAEKERTNAAA